ncbi:MAG: serine/threonine protein kinase, partial [Isosphaeraceae bacterium]|nr:serine/threonine protein kinase [Isosphaeraceae bacterium]
VPALALALVVTFLVWWGQGVEPASLPPAAMAPPTPIAQRDLPKPAATRPDRVGSTEAAKDQSGKATASVPSVEAAPKPPPVVTVGAGEDLGAVLAAAPSGATVILADAGPFDLRPESISRISAVARPRRDLVLKAAPDVRPILRPARGGDPALGEAALLRFGSGRVVLEGLEFQLVDDEREDPLAAIFADDTDLTLRRCLFRRPGMPDSSVRLAAVQVRAPARSNADEGRPAPVRIVDSHFDGGQVAVLARGPATVELRDCTIGPATPALWVEAAAWPAQLRLQHVSIIAGEGAVFRFSRAAALVRVDDSVIASARYGEATLVATDEPDRLDWHGWGNLYGGITTYLLLTRGQADAAPLRSFARWRDGTDEPREADSIAREGHLWAENDPIAALTALDP